MKSKPTECTLGRCYRCRSTVFIHRRGKPFTCKTCGLKRERRLS